MTAPDEGFAVNPDELIEMMTAVGKAGSALSDGLQKVRDGLLLTQTAGQGWEVDAPLASCAGDWLRQMLELTAATSRASENLARSAQSYLDTDDGVCALPDEEQ